MPQQGHSSNRCDLLIIHSGIAVMLAVKLVDCPQQYVQASICGSVFCTEGLPQSIIPAGAACKLIL